MLNPSLTPTESSNGAGEVLERFARTRASGCLLVTERTVEWRFYFHQGQLTHATNSIDPFERLERHLRGLSAVNSQLSGAVRERARSLFANAPPSENCPQTADYRAILWLIQQKYLSATETRSLVAHLAGEVLQSYLLLDTIEPEFIPYSPVPLVHLDYRTFLQDCRAKLQGWQKLTPHVQSSYQRPYLIEQGTIVQSLPKQQRDKLKKILIGFNFRQLAVLVNQDPLVLARNLYPLIAKGAIRLRAPQPPFDRLPTLSREPDPRASLAPPEEIAPTRAIGTTKLVCVDDSPAMLKAIKQFLSGHDVEIHTITDPLKALREIVRLEPKLILLDVGMPDLDGYRLCRLIRNHSLFKETPIIMVTGNTGMIDRAKAKVAGATDYLTKPFSQSDLEQMVSKYLVF